MFKRKLCKKSLINTKKSVDVKYKLWYYLKRATEKRIAGHLKQNREDKQK